ncbi:DUF6279 family lipoprotein [Microbulbifer spongiae]|uniref:DUF6279 family lipoprotein n=1 Tax=Microbulbifer spongiae TaxID=2944933 RepID=A0ABY9EE92_9GAMM|nr:DUF6279 family lipoprotein [Microbulbifer sp. MI-G]WKD50696.1 DUF6279 family lipoprotein [Microbulbifer sp. MI-G]
MAQPPVTLIRPFWRKVALIAFFVCVGSCSSVQFAYNNVDYWIRWKIRDYVDLNRAQAVELQAAMDSFFRWHRQTQLQRYAEFLTHLADGVDKGALENPRLEPVEQQLQQFLHSASDSAYDLLLPIVAQLDKHQIDELQKNLQKKQQQALEEWQQPPEKIRRKRNRQIRKEGERWLGHLSQEQIQLIAAWVSKVEYNPQSRSAQRQRWQSKAIDLLRSKPPGYLETLRNLLVDPQQLWPPHYRQAQERRQEQARELAEQILASTSPAQRHHLSRALREYARNFRILASQ